MRGSRECVLEAWPHNERASAAGGWGASSLQVSHFGFAEDEKDDGIAMSVVSSEAVKTPPNGDHVEAQAVQIDCPPVPGASSDLFHARQPAEEGEMNVCDSGGDLAAEGSLKLASEGC